MKRKKKCWMVGDVETVIEIHKSKGSRERGVGKESFETFKKTLFIFFCMNA